MNMSNQVKLFKEGHLPVFRTEKTQEWARIKQPIQSNAVVIKTITKVKTEEGFKVTFKHLFANSSKHYFAFTYPWTVKENETLIEELIHERKNKIFCFYETLAKTSNNRKVMLLTLTKKQPSTKIEFTKFNNLQQEVCVFPQKPVQNWLIKREFLLVLACIQEKLQRATLWMEFWKHYFLIRQRLHYY